MTNSSNQVAGKRFLASELSFEEWIEEQEDGSFQFTTFADVKDKIKNLEVKQGDVWIMTYPKSGTTWMQEMVWLLTHNLDYEGAKALLKYRSPGLDSIWAQRFQGRPDPPPGSFERNASLSGGRRVIKSHQRLGLLPDKLRDPNIAKIIYVARNPKDVCVSFYYFNMLYEVFRGMNITMDDFSRHFIGDRVVFGPYWQHVKEFWNLRDKPNVFFVTYEEMKKDLEKVVTDVATFLEVPIPTGADMTKLLDHLSFESMKKNPALNRESGEGNFQTDIASEDLKFFRKGVVGNWKEKLSPEIVKEFDEWIAKHTKDTGITFGVSV